MRTSVIPINTHTAKKPAINLQSKSTGINWLVYIRNGLWLVKFHEKLFHQKNKRIENKILARKSVYYENSRIDSIRLSRF